MDLTLIQKAKNVAKAAQTWVLAGMPIVKKEDHLKRVNICKGCYFYEKGWCKQCGCNIEIKAWLATEPCPLGAWSTCEEDKNI